VLTFYDGISSWARQALAPEAVYFASPFKDGTGLPGTFSNKLVTLVGGNETKGGQEGVTAEPGINPCPGIRLHYRAFRELEIEPFRPQKNGERYRLLVTVLIRSWSQKF
jgi:hypothetical protein